MNLLIFISLSEKKMMAELKLQKSLYDYWEEFYSQYTDEDTLPDGTYKGPDGELYDEKEIKEMFIDVLNGELNKFVNEELGGGYRFTYEKDNIPF